MRASSSRTPADDPYGILKGIDPASLPSLAKIFEDGDFSVTAALAPPEESCASCGGQLCRGVSGPHRVCEGCGLIVEGDTAEPDEDGATRPPPSAARLRIVGPNSYQFQPNLYGSGTANTAATQRKQVYEEYLKYCEDYKAAGGRAFAVNICSRAADIYNEIQRLYVKRSHSKQAIMAACFYTACLELDMSPSKQEIATLLQLPSNGIARGVNFIRKMVADGAMTVDVNADPSHAEIVTLFAQLKLEDAAYDPLRAAVAEVVKVATANNIGINSILRTKVAGATFEVIRRCKDRDLIAAPLSLNDFCADRIRKNTIERFLKEMHGFHSHFEACYKAAGLDASRMK